jgi:hypothetical protein
MESEIINCSTRDFVDSHLQNGIRRDNQFRGQRG